jgi:hypothetical protein
MKKIPFHRVSRSLNPRLFVSVFPLSMLLMCIQFCILHLMNSHWWISLKTLMIPFYIPFQNLPQIWLNLKLTSAHVNGLIQWLIQPRVYLFHQNRSFIVHYSIFLFNNDSQVPPFIPWSQFDLQLPCRIMVVPIASYLMMHKRYITYTSLSVRQLDGSQVLAKVYGVPVTRPTKSTHMLALWSSFYYPSAPPSTKYMFTKCYQALSSSTFSHHGTYQASLNHPPFISVASVPFTPRHCLV